MLILLLRALNRNIKANIVNYLEYILIYVIVFSFTFLLPVLYDNEIGPYIACNCEGVSFDGIDSVQYELWRKDNPAQLSCKVRTFTGELSNGRKTADISLNTIDSWDNLDCTPWNINHSISGNTENLAENSLILDVYTAQILHLSIGDQCCISIGPNGEVNVPFVVKMIVSPDSENIITGSAECLYTGYFDDYWCKAWPDDNEDFYTYIFFSQIPEKFKKCCRTISAIRDGAIEEFGYTPALVYAISAMGLVILLIFQIHEVSTKINSEKNVYRILLCEGMRWTALAKYIVCENFMYMVPASLCSVLLVKNVIYRCFVGRYYLRKEILVWAVIVSVLAGLIFSWMIVWVRSKKIDINPGRNSDE